MYIYPHRTKVMSILLKNEHLCLHFIPTIKMKEEKKIFRVNENADLKWCRAMFRAAVKHL